MEQCGDYPLKLSGKWRLRNTIYQAICTSSKAWFWIMRTLAIRFGIIVSRINWLRMRSCFRLFRTTSGIQLENVSDLICLSWWPGISFRRLLLMSRLSSLMSNFSLCESFLDIAFYLTTYPSLMSHMFFFYWYKWIEAIFRFNWNDNRSSWIFRCYWNDNRSSWNAGRKAVSSKKKKHGCRSRKDIWSVIKNVVRSMDYRVLWCQAV